MVASFLVPNVAFGYISNHKNESKRGNRSLRGRSLSNAIYKFLFQQALRISRNALFMYGEELYKLATEFKMVKLHFFTFLFCILCGLNTIEVEAWGEDKVKLTDVKVLTLHHGKMTTGRRTNPVPQVQCIGGSAGCDAFVPRVIQCYNRGTDGIDVQWECKTDMDNAFRFGAIDVLCEGYDHPNDPYILKGSCGVEYTLDLTLEGYQKKGGSHNYYGQGKPSHQHNYISEKRSFKYTDILLIAIVLLIIYGVIKTCLRSNQYTRTNDDYPGGPDYPHSTGYYPSGVPPPPGFRSDYFGDASCSRGQDRGPGFWSGAVAGGILGYLFGNSGQEGYYNRRRSYQSSTPSWGETSSGGTSASDFSSGTRTASGFGGTRRR